MRFATFTQISEDGATTTILISPAHVFAVIAAISLDGRKPDVSAILTAQSGDRGINVVGSVAEVVAALEAATAPPAPAPVAVEPDIGAVLLCMLDVLAEAADDGGWDYLDETAIDVAMTGAPLDGWEDTAKTIRSLANRLRRGA